MTEVGNVYGGALYELCRDEGVSDLVRGQLETLQTCFRQEPDFTKLLATPSLPKVERCEILENSFRGNVHEYVLNFLKILTEKGYIRHFPECCDAFFDRYNEENGILPVAVVTAAPLSQTQSEKLRQKLDKITGKRVTLRCRLDPTVLGGIRLDYDGQRLDDTVSHRLDAIRDTLRKTAL